MKSFKFFFFLFLLTGILIAFSCSGDDDDDDNDDNNDDNGDDDVADDDAADDDSGDDDNDSGDDDDSSDDDNDSGDDDDDSGDDDDDNTPGTADLIENGGFETGDATGWTGEWPYDELVHSEDLGDDDTSPDTTWYILPHTGSYAVWFGQTHSQHTAWLGQTVTVPSDVTTAEVRAWHYLYKFGSCSFTLTLKLVNPNNPNDVLLDLGSWTQADASFIANYKEFVHQLSTAELSSVQGENVMLRYEYTGQGALISGCYVYLDDVSFDATW